MTSFDLDDSWLSRGVLINVYYYKNNEKNNSLLSQTKKSLPFYPSNVA